MSGSLRKKTGMTHWERVLIIQEVHLVKKKHEVKLARTKVDADDARSNIHIVY